MPHLHSARSGRPDQASAPASRRWAPALRLGALAGVALLLSLAAEPLAAGPTAAGPTAGPPQAGAPASPAPDPEALALLERAAERHRGIETFCADFEQVVENEILRQTTRSRGELCQARPDRFEMRFTDPQGDRVVADGTHLWVYFPSTDPGQAFRTDPGEAGGRFDLHREFLADPGVRYRPALDGRETVNGRATRILRLDPASPGSSPFTRARVWVDEADALVRKVEITETEGFVRTVTLSGMRLNPVPGAGWFRFDPPTGVRVVVR
jgi:outer membrane lipoprotein carrier protein